jgi:hypothetical protein
VGLSVHTPAATDYCGLTEEVRESASPPSLQAANGYSIHFGSLAVCLSRSGRGQLSRLGSPSPTRACNPSSREETNPHARATRLRRTETALVHRTGSGYTWSPLWRAIARPTNSLTCANMSAGRIVLVKQQHMDSHNCQGVFSRRWACST